MTSLSHGFPYCVTTDGRHCSSPSIADVDRVLTASWAELDNTNVRDYGFCTAPVSGTDITLITVMAAAYAWHGRDDESLFVKQMR